MKNIKWIIMAFVFFSCSSKTEKEAALNGADILKKSIEFHDPNQHWDNSEIGIHVQEPRLNNPFRYSEVKLNVLNGSFELIRNRENHISKHTIDEEGYSKVYLDNKENLKIEDIKKYKLDAKRNYGYRDFYKMLIGLPMSLKDSAINSIGVVELKEFNHVKCFMVPIVLKDPIFSNYWNIFINKSTFQYQGMEIVFPDDSTKGERLLFEGEITINGMKIPRIRHWHEYYNNNYSGSDIILKELE